ncbi:prolyl oligopeptidase family serine peptidase [Sphingopyxis panaciterrae]|uniref:prolyl oligopeptidase family serine peptidase n=1 Tax=Sphingopyxis panaciterrae TaxID=363841 RepID=UPI001ABB9725|nr:prolyl oligopeptidase family serine peptidase [Sphingopyxis panaciterrae]
MRVLVSTAALITACAAIAQEVPKASVEAPKVPFTETRHDRTIEDPYRWMEDPKRKDELARYVHAQSNMTVERLSNLPQRAVLVDLIDAASRAGTQMSALRLAGDRTFWQQLDTKDRVPKLMVRDKTGTRILYDPASESGTSAGPAAINNYNVSPDGRTVAVHVSFGGGEVGAIRFVESDTGRETLGRLRPVWGEFTVQWLTDEVVTFTRIPPKAAGDDPMTDMVAVVGTPGGAFKPILGPGIAGGPAFSPSAFPLIRATGLSDWIIGLADNVIDPAVFLARRGDLVAGKPAWREVAPSTDRVVDFATREDSLYLITRREVSNGQLVRIPGSGGPQQVIPMPDGYVLSALAATRDGLYVLGQRDGASHLFWLSDAKGRASEIRLPFEAAIRGLAATADGSAATFMLTGWTTASRGFVARAGKLSPADVDSATWSEAAKLSVRQELARSADGTMVPMVIIGQAGTIGPQPTLIEAYGSYGASTTRPYYDPFALAWSARGHNMIYCGTRGGGERGREWHDGGRLQNKANAHADLIACGEKAVGLGLTAPRKLAITGTSAGGLLVPMAAEKRPDLFAALVSRVAILNATRIEVAENGANNFIEMGDPRTESGWKALAAQDAYLGLLTANDLPDTLLTIGLNDRRVAPWMSAKFAARAQSIFGNKRLILIRAESEGGHGIGSARDLEVQEFADIFAFLEDRLGAERRLPSSMTRMAGASGKATR